MRREAENEEGRRRWGEGTRAERKGPQEGSGGRIGFFQLTSAPGFSSPLNVTGTQLKFMVHWKFTAWICDAGTPLRRLGFKLMMNYCFRKVPARSLVSRRSSVPGIHCKRIRAITLPEAFIVIHAKLHQRKISEEKFLHSWFNMHQSTSIIFLFLCKLLLKPLSFIFFVFFLVNLLVCGYINLPI